MVPPRPTQPRYKTLFTPRLARFIRNTGRIQRLHFPPSSRLTRSSSAPSAAPRSTGSSKLVLVTRGPVSREQQQDTGSRPQGSSSDSSASSIALASLAAEAPHVLTATNVGLRYGAMPPAMSAPGSRALTIGLAVMLLCVSAGVHFGGFGLLLSFMGVLVGASLVATGVRMADGPSTPIVAVVFAGARALAAFVRRNTAATGLVMASCAFTVVVSGEEDPVLCFGMFTLLLLGLILVNIGARGE